MPDGPHIIVPLPHGPEFPNDGPLRVGWTNYARTLPHVDKVVTPSVHPYGWRGRSIADAVFNNAEIRNLAVPRRPALPVDIADFIWADDFQRKNNLVGPFVTVEYISYSLKIHDITWYAQLIPLVKCPIVALAGLKDPQLPGAVDARGCTYRQSKVLIMRSKCFVGCASGNGFMCASEGCETPMVEVVEPHISYKACGYMSQRPYEVTGFNRTPQEIANIVNRMF